MAKQNLIIDGRLRREIREAIVRAFASLVEFRAVLCESLGIRLALVTPAVDLREAVFETILWAVDHRRLPELIAAASAEKPRDASLQKLAQEFAAGKSERVIRNEIPFFDAAKSMRNYMQARRAVCRIESPDEYGTGFLIGPSVVLTNHHVVKNFPQKPRRGSASIVFRFGYEHGRDGVSVKAGKAYKLSRDWLLFHSTEDALDFALVHIAGHPGNEWLSAKRRRGWTTPVEHTFVDNEPLFILQHAAGLPLTLSPGAVTEREDGDWVRYNVNTKSGSSGSPCLTFGGDVAAIHHWSFTSYNRGVRCSAILAHLKANRARLKRKGVSDLLHILG